MGKELLLQLMIEFTEIITNFKKIPKPEEYNIRYPPSPINSNFFFFFLNGGGRVQHMASVVKKWCGKMSQRQFKRDSI